MNAVSGKASPGKALDSGLCGAQAPHESLSAGQPPATLGEGKIMVRPEEVGLSSERLARIRPAVGKHIGDDKIAGFGFPAGCILALQCRP